MGDSTHHDNDRQRGDEPEDDGGGNIHGGQGPGRPQGIFGWVGERADDRRQGAGSHPDDGAQHAAGGQHAASQTVTSNQAATEGLKSTSATQLRKKGTSAILISDVTAKIRGKPHQLRAGTFVDVVQEQGEHTLCQVYTGNDGREAWVPTPALHREPQLLEGAAAAGDGAVGYMQYRGALWNGQPKPSDVDQGALNDCYIMAPAAAIAANNPHAIMALFSPHEPNQPCYQVTLYVREGERVKRVTQTIDTEMPSDGNLKDNKGTPIYDGHNNPKNKLDTASRRKPLWPLLLEKAFATLQAGQKGGYDSLDEGGVAAPMMEMITGERPNAILNTNDGLAKLRALHAAGEAVVCNTTNDPKQAELRKRLRLHEWHFYMFQGFQGEDLLFKNPWGFNDPAPVSPASFQLVFGSIQSIPKHGEGAQHGGPGDIFGGGNIHGGGNGGGNIHGGETAQVSPIDAQGGGNIHGGQAQS